MELKSVYICLNGAANWYLNFQSSIISLCPIFEDGGPLKPTEQTFQLNTRFEIWCCKKSKDTNNQYQWYKTNLVSLVTIESESNDQVGELGDSNLKVFGLKTIIPSIARVARTKPFSPCNRRKKNG